MISSGTQIGKFTFLNHLDSGAFGAVYKVRDVTIDRISAVKVLPIDPSASDLSEIKGIVEGRTQLDCNHPNCVKLRSVEVLDINGGPNIALEMEFLPDGSLQSQLESKFISLCDSSNYIAGALYGLQHAHAKGILHRDVKPGNILLENNIPKLSDFGISSASKDTNGWGSGAGYITHCAPEVFSDEITSELTDIFATGMTYYRLVNNITDWAAFTAGKENLIESGTLIKSAGYALWVPEKIKRIVNKACHKESAKRYQSCVDFRQAIEKLRFYNNWQLTQGTWTSNLDGQQVISQFKKRKFHVEHKVKGRRKTTNCQSFDTSVEARKFVSDIVRETTLR